MLASKEEEIDKLKGRGNNQTPPKDKNELSETSNSNSRITALANPAATMFNGKKIGGGPNETQ
jgi:hypothetical protein